MRFKDVPLWGWTILLFGGAIVVLSIMLGRARAEQVSLALKADSLQAVADTTRRTSLSRRDSLKIFGDSLSAVERRVVQTKISNDALDNALHRASVLITRLDATIQNFNVKNRPGTAVTLVSSDTSIRQSTFHIDSTPYHVDATAKLPPPPRVGTLDLAIHMDTVFMRPRLQCGEAVDGVKPATILVETPTWLTNVKINQSLVSPSACNPQLITKRDWSPWWAIPAAFIAGAAVKAAISK
jgi:hypothetical protein